MGPLYLEFNNSSQRTLCAEDLPEVVCCGPSGHQSFGKWLEPGGPKSHKAGAGRWWGLVDLELRSLELRVSLLRISFAQRKVAALVKSDTDFKSFNQC